MEFALRVFFSFQVGPRVLLYGTPLYRNIVQDVSDPTHYKAQQAWQTRQKRFNTIDRHDSKLDGYSKYFPNEQKIHNDVDTGKIFPVKINSRGLRGEEFSLNKKEGVIRVLTLGASSTFGYYNRDTETYPYVLEQLLNARCKNTTQFEVINFAIPHANSGNILALFLAEGVSLNPDIVTLYSGRNNSMSQRLFGRSVPLSRRLMIFRFLQYLFEANRKRYKYPVAPDFEMISEQVSQSFINDINLLYEETAKRDIHLIIANQQANSKSTFGRPKVERMKSKGITYADEVGGIRNKIEDGKPIDYFELMLLVHSRMMKDLHAFATAHDIPFVDVIKLLDNDRHYLLSWVHLHPEANRKVAVAFSDAIANTHCQS